uniref:Septin 4a n=1 Tax=Hippocampus comes TaxID=109280 RepID=A0A3Q2XRC0_HIPCM
MDDREREYVGLAELPDQVRRKTARKGFAFTLMVAGESGLGKSTLINALFLTDLYKDRKIANAQERIRQTVRTAKRTVSIEENGVKLRLSIVDTPGFGDAVDNTRSWKHLEDYVERQLDRFFRDESGLDRRNIRDHRVHCCLYFISPYGHGYAAGRAASIAALPSQGPAPSVCPAACGRWTWSACVPCTTKSTWFRCWPKPTA